MRLSVFTYLAVLVFSLLALLVVLGFTVLFGVGPMAPNAPVPGLPPSSSGAAVGLGEARSLTEAPGPQRASATVPSAAAPAQSGAAAGDAAAGPRSEAASTVGSRRVVAAAPQAADRSPSGPQRPSREDERPAPAPADSAPLPVQPPPSPARPTLVADFERGLEGWTAVPGDRLPRLSGFNVRDGSTASVMRLAGSEGRSSLVLGGDGRLGEPTDGLQIGEGASHAFAFSFHIDSMTYGEVGADNLIMRIAGQDEGRHSLGLQLWELGEDPAVQPARGLWSDGEATAGPRFLAPVQEGVWHDVVVHFTASSQGAGFYEIYLDGILIDAKAGASLIPAGSSAVHIEVGLMRDPSRVTGTSQIRIDSAKLGDTLDSVLP